MELMIIYLIFFGIIFGWAILVGFGSFLPIFDLGGTDDMNIRRIFFILAGTALPIGIFLLAMTKKSLKHAYDRVDVEINWRGERERVNITEDERKRRERKARLMIVLPMVGGGLTMIAFSLFFFRYLWRWRRHGDDSIKVEEGVRRKHRPRRHAPESEG